MLPLIVISIVGAMNAMSIINNINLTSSCLLRYIDPSTYKNNLDVLKLTLTGEISKPNQWEEE
jgi:hypothetical protein